MELYDVTNGLVVDFDMVRYKEAEIPLTIKRLEKIQHLFTNPSKEEFTTKEIISLYSKGWDMECSYRMSVHLAIANYITIRAGI